MALPLPWAGVWRIARWAEDRERGEVLWQLRKPLRLKPHLLNKLHTLLHRRLAQAARVDQFDLVAFHHIDPGLWIQCGLLEPVGLPVTAQGMAVLCLELKTVRDRRVAVGLAPRRVLVSTALPADFDDMKRHRDLRGAHIARDVPGVDLSGDEVVVDAVGGDPAVKLTGIIREGRTVPFQFSFEDPVQTEGMRGVQDNGRRLVHRK